MIISKKLQAEKKEILKDAALHKSVCEMVKAVLNLEVEIKNQFINIKLTDSMLPKEQPK